MNGRITLQKQLTTFAKIYQEKPAIIETATDDQISYGELTSAVAGMRQFLGERPQRIMVALPGGIVDAVIWLSILTGGHTMLPVSPTLTEYEYHEYIADHEPDMIIAEDTTVFAKHTAKVQTLAQCQAVIQKAIRNHTPLTSPPTDGSVCLSTSGSTGKPKTMLLSASKLVITAQNIIKSHQLTDQDRGLTPLPFHHVNAPIVSLLASVLSGGTVIIAPKFSVKRFWSWVQKYDPTWISIVPTIVAILLTTDRPDFLDHASLRFVRTASAPLPEVYLTEFEEKFRIPVIETYGISEAGSTIFANPVPPDKHKAGSVGFPLGIRLRLCRFDEDTQQLTDVPQGETGEVCIQGPHVIAAYEDNRSPESFVDGWFRTGDLGYVDDEGYLHLTGRIKDIIIRGGENIAPREIEEVLLTHANIREATVVGKPDPIYGEVIAAFVVLKEAEAKTTTDELKTYAAARLSPQKVPMMVTILNELPKGKTGKVDKGALRALHNA